MQVAVSFSTPTPKLLRNWSVSTVTPSACTSAAVSEGQAGAVLAAAAARSYPRERVAVGVTADADRAAGVSAVVVALEVALVAEFAPSVAGVR